MENKEPAIKTGGENLTVEDNLHIDKEDRTTVSRSKLELLKFMADDVRMRESFWSTDKFFSTIGFGSFFAAIGALTAYHDLSAFGQQLCISALFLSPLFVLYCGYKQYETFREKYDFRGKLAAKIDDIIQQMNRMAALNESKKSDSQKQD